MSAYWSRLKTALLPHAALFLVGALAVPAAAAGTKTPPYPPALHGVWFNDDREGNAQCRAYNKAGYANDDELSLLLVGAVLISGSMMHDYAEYGEGNFYELRAIEKTGSNSWRIAVAIGIDTSPEASQLADDTFTMQLIRGKLTIRTKPHLLDLEDSWKVDQQLRRCASIR